MAGTKPIPDEYPGITPYLIVNDASQAIDFYNRAFGAREVERMAGPNGRVMHAEVRIGNTAVMLADEFPDMGIRSATSYGGSPVILLIYVEDSDAAVARAAAAGAKIVRPVQDQFYGDRAGTVTDPFGHMWTISTRKENLTREQIHERARTAGCPG